MRNGIRTRSTVFLNALDRQTDRPTDRRTYGPTDRPRESSSTIGRYATRATRPNNNNKSTQSNFGRGPRRGAVARVHRTPYAEHWLQWRAPNSPPKVPLPVDRSQNPTTCLIPGPARPLMRNGIRIRSAVFPQYTGQTDAPTDRPRENFMTISPCATRATLPNNNSSSRNSAKLAYTMRYDTIILICAKEKLTVRKRSHLHTLLT